MPFFDMHRDFENYEALWRRDTLIRKAFLFFRTVGCIYICTYIKAFYAVSKQKNSRQHSPMKFAPYFSE